MANKRKVFKLIKGFSFMIIGCALMIVLFSSAMNVLQRQDEIAVLEKQKAELQNEVELLNDEDYVARYARENYIFSRDGEQVSIIPGVE